MNLLNESPKLDCKLWCCKLLFCHKCVMCYSTSAQEVLTAHAQCEAHTLNLFQTTAHIFPGTGRRRLACWGMVSVRKEGSKVPPCEVLSSRVVRVQACWWCGGTEQWAGCGVLSWSCCPRTCSSACRERKGRRGREWARLT